jgi:protease-4
MLHKITRATVGVLTVALLSPLMASADTPGAAESAKPAAKAAPAKAAPAKAAPAKPSKIAHIKLSGSMEEKAPTVDPLLGNIGETFRDKLERIRKAGTDKEIAAVLLEINGVSAGWGKLNDLGQAIASVRAAGKKVFAHVEGGSSRDYLLALACDEVCMPESTWLMLTGIRMEVSFYKDLLKMIGVQADILHIGDFKGAAEPLTRDSLSEPNRKQLNSIINDYYEHEIVGRIVKARKLSTSKVKKLIDKGPYSAGAALNAKLIDRLAYLEAYEEEIKQTVGGHEVKVVKDYQKKKEEDVSVFALYRKLLFGPSTSSSSRANKVAVIYANGAITTGKSSASVLGGEVMGSETIIKALRQAEEDKTVKAIVLRVDSPGGSALASDLIWNEMKRCKKPIIASMADIAGSGGYYICIAARKIYAEPGTLTGSIGVVGGKLATRGLWDKVGIKTEVISRGAHSGILTSDDPFSPTERKAMMAMMEDVYKQFVDKSLEGRQKAGKKMTRKELLDLAGGRIYTGRQAKENGLIDELGTLRDAIAEAAKMGGLPADKTPDLLLLPKSKGLFESLLGDHDVSLSALLNAAQLKPELLGKLRGIDGMLQLRREPVWAMLPFRISVE